MKILYLAMKHDYGDPIRGLSFEQVNFYNSLEHMGHELVQFDFMQRFKEVGFEKLNCELRELAFDLQPDLLFSILFTDQLDKKVLKEISTAGHTVTFNWFCDDHWRFDNYSKEWAGSFNWVATTAASAMAKYKAMGFHNVIKTQWACNHFLYKPTEERERYDVTFIGQPHGNRKKIIDQLRADGIDVQTWGHGWNRGRVSQEEMIAIFSQSKINLNLANSSVGNFSKWKFWKKPATEQIKGRNFEVPGCGGFLLTSAVENLDEYYAPDKEVVSFASYRELRKKLHHYLTHDQERRRIAEQGYQRTLRDHTYEKRFNEIFSRIF